MMLFLVVASSCGCFILNVYKPKLSPRSFIFHFCRLVSHKAQRSTKTPIHILGHPPARARRRGKLNVTGGGGGVEFVAPSPPKPRGSSVDRPIAAQPGRRSPEPQQLRPVSPPSDTRKRLEVRWRGGVSTTLVAGACASFARTCPPPSPDKGLAVARHFRPTVLI